MHIKLKLLIFVDVRYCVQLVATQRSRNTHYFNPASFFVSSRLYTQTHKRFKISEERVKDHIQTLGLFQQPGVEALREPGDDPYDFKEGDIEYTFSTSKRLKSQGREASKKVKVGRLPLHQSVHAHIVSLIA